MTMCIATIAHKCVIITMHAYWGRRILIDCHASCLTFRWKISAMAQTAGNQSDISARWASKLHGLSRIVGRTQDGHEKQNAYGLPPYIKQFQLDCLSQDHLRPTQALPTIRIVCGMEDINDIEVVCHFMPAIPEDTMLVYFTRCQSAVDLIRLCILGRCSHRRYPMRNVKPPLFKVLLAKLHSSRAARQWSGVGWGGVGWDVVSHHGIGNATLRISMVLATFEIIETFELIRLEMQLA
ncbi:hypothetical protein DBV15_05166 [Temnothorax longispinosus]|uniref:Uncharacterized protein n=1 Tax=Temnothorax longispinosus TaxID=300112 RepID=A0A4S2KXL9_9HYME|nr:hypothetical protein DBV15_05166 [Temnothorax longispinosus]